MIGDMFSRMAGEYDFMNDVFSLGIHRLWKQTFVEMMGPLKMKKILNERGEITREEPLKVLDMAGGTGDISFNLLAHAKREALGSIRVNINCYRVAGRDHDG